MKHSQFQTLIFLVLTIHFKMKNHILIQADLYTKLSMIKAIFHKYSVSTMCRVITNSKKSNYSDPPSK